MDRTDIRRILFNLVANSRDAMTSSGTVVVSVAETTVEVTGAHPAVYVVLIVRDSGVGMDEETLARAFDPFFSTKADGRGTGLGLAVVRSIVERGGGFVRVESAPGAGTTVRVVHPADLVGTVSVVRAPTVA